MNAELKTPSKRPTRLEREALTRIKALRLNEKYGNFDNYCEDEQKAESACNAALDAISRERERMIQELDAVLQFNAERIEKSITGVS